MKLRRVLPVLAASLALAGGAGLAGATSAQAVPAAVSADDCLTGLGTPLPEGDGWVCYGGTHDGEPIDLGGL